MKSNNYKICEVCGNRKLLFEFYKILYHKDKVYYRQPCKDCYKLEYKKYRQKHNKEIKIEAQKYRDNNKAKIKRINKEYLKLNPWVTTCTKARARCNNPKQKGYKDYGERGIKCLMTLKDFKYLWERDKAYLLKKPSIDRKDNDGNYTLRNCRFIELSENSRKGNYEKRKKNKAS